MRFRIAALLLALATTHTAALGQYTNIYVDAVSGDDSNTGLSEATPFQTLTRATTYIAATSNGLDLHLILAQPGTYDTALGEVFPIRIMGNTSFRGETSLGGPLPIIDAGGSSVAVITDGEDPVAPQKGIVRLAIANAGIGMVFEDGSPDRFVRYLTSCTFRDCGVAIQASSATGFPIDGQIAACTFEDCDTGIAADGDRWINVTGTTFTRCSVDAVNAFQLASLSLTDCSFQDSGTAVNAETSPAFVSNVNLRLCVLSGCQVGLNLVEAAPSTLGMSVIAATIADCGIGIAVPGPALSSGSLNGSILDGNTVNVMPAQAGLQASESIVNGTPIFGPGIVSLDPLFRDPTAGDYRLSPDSPAIDRLPVLPILPFLDGNLDTVGKRDFGGLPSHPLERLGGPVRIGTDATFEVAGNPNGWALALLQTEFPLVNTLTPYGLLVLQPSLTERVAVLPVDATTGLATWVLPIPADPSLVGFTWFTQALSRSTQAPAGAAFTNMQAFVIQE